MICFGDRPAVRVVEIPVASAVRPCSACVSSGMQPLGERLGPAVLRIGAAPDACVGAGHRRAHCGLPSEAAYSGAGVAASLPARWPPSPTLKRRIRRQLPMTGGDRQRKLDADPSLLAPPASRSPRHPGVCLPWDPEPVFRAGAAPSGSCLGYRWGRSGLWAGQCSDPPQRAGSRRLARRRRGTWRTTQGSQGDAGRLGGRGERRGARSDTRHVELLGLAFPILQVLECNILHV